MDRARAANNTNLVTKFDLALAAMATRAAQAEQAKAFAQKHGVLAGWVGPNDDLGQAIQQAMKNSGKSATPVAKLTEDFFSTLEKPDCKELRTTVENLLRTFSKSKADIEEDGDLLSQCFQDIQDAMKAHPLWSSLQVSP